MTKKKQKHPEVIQIRNPERDLAWEAWNVAIKYIQDKMGVTAGDHAAHFFFDPLNDNAMHMTVDLLEDYIKAERKKSEEEPTL